MTATPKIGIPYVELNQTNAETYHNEGMLDADSFIGLQVIDRNLTAPPGGESDGDIYIPTAPATGAWAGEEDNLAIIFNSGWSFVEPWEGLRIRVLDEHITLEYDGSAWREVMLASKFTAQTVLAATVANTPAALTVDEQRVVGRVTSGNVAALTPANLWSILDDTNQKKSVTAGITAGTTQSQGQVPLTTDINEVATCANPNDVVTLPTAVAGMEIVVINNGASTLQIFPASGDNIDGTGVDSPITLAAAGRTIFWAIDDTNWYSK